MGQGILGLFIPIGLILGLPTMVETANKYYPSQQSKVNNMSSGIFNTFLGLGEVIGPLFGATMCEKVSFRKTSDIIALICVAYALIFFLFGLYDPRVQP